MKACGILLILFLIISGNVFSQTQFRIEHTIPSDGDRDVELNTRIQVYFTQNINESTISGNISLKLLNGNEIPITYTVSTNLLTILPQAGYSLVPLTEYHLFIGQNIRSITDNALGENRTLIFITKRVLNPLNSIVIYPNPVTLDSTIKLQYQLDKTLENVQLKIYNRKRRFVHSIDLDSNSGVNTHIWDLIDSKGNKITPNIYYLIFKGYDNNGIEYEVREKMAVIP